MKKYVYCMTGNEVWFNVAKYLFLKEIARPVLWLGDDAHFENAKALFGEDVLKMDSFVHYQEEIERINYHPENVDFLLSDNYLRAKDRCLKMMDRLDLYGTFLRIDREAVFNKLCIWYLNKIDHVKPDAMIVAEIPHSHAQYLLLEICLFKGIEVAKFNTWMPVPLLFLQNVRTGQKITKDISIKGSYFDMFDRNINEFVRNIKERVNKNAVYEISYMKKLRESNRFINRLKNFLLLGAKDLTKEAIFQFRKQLSKDYYKINPFKLNFSSLKKIQRQRKKSLIRNLQINQTPIEKNKKNKKFVYFALHFEPERTTNPDGGLFHDQVLAIISLRKILPEEIYIYVKEHPSQFYMSDRGSRGRSPLFYELINNIKNVELINVDTDSIDMIKNSVFIATISGTAAVEASIMGKKALVFGDTWFHGCPNVFKWSDELTFETILSSRVYESDDILDFLKKQKNQFAVSGCQNISEQRRYPFSKKQDFLDEEFMGVKHLLEKFFEGI